MPKQAATTAENNFRNGLMTEASGLNFPENFCTATWDCAFNFDGSVLRRTGFDYETGYALKEIDRDGCVVTSYLWRNVAGNGDDSVCVVQVGGTLYFYEVQDSGTLSGGAVSATVSLSSYKPSTVSEAELNENECQFTVGNGYLFVAHRYCNTLRIQYNITTHAATVSQITIEIRDLEGDLSDPFATDQRPAARLEAVDRHHLYNLKNQGWTAVNLNTWDRDSRTTKTMPSNVDVMWYFKNAANVFNPGRTQDDVMHGNSPCPKGHYILPLYDQDRATISGVTGATSTSIPKERITTIAFYAGRIFYSGLSADGENSKIFFSQIVEHSAQYGRCHQSNDLTSQDVYDLLSSDGGVIKVPDAGSIHKLYAISGGLVVFASNGVWHITGSTGLGFTASDYVVNKISSIETISASSFVDVAGFPAWWNNDGIYILTSEGGSPTIQSLTLQSIKTFYDAIPHNSKLNARGYFNNVTGVIQWMYRSTSSDDITTQHDYDRILNYNAYTKAFYPWTISASNVKANSLIVTPSDLGGSEPTSAFKYIVSVPSGSTYNFTFANEHDTSYVDWYTYDSTGVDYTSYFVSGYKLHGSGLNKFQSHWVAVFSRSSQATKYYFQGLWNYALTGDTGRWSSKQYISHTDTDYAYLRRRFKIRGAGTVLQLKVTSLPGEPFDITGWVTFETANTVP